MYCMINIYKGHSFDRNAVIVDVMIMIMNTWRTGYCWRDIDCSTHAFRSTVISLVSCLFHSRKCSIVDVSYNLASKYWLPEEFLETLIFLSSRIT